MSCWWKYERSPTFSRVQASGAVDVCVCAGVCGIVCMCTSVCFDASNQFVFCHSLCAAFTSNGVVDSLLAFLYPQRELVEVWPDFVATMEEYQRVLEVPSCIKCLCLL